MAETTKTGSATYTKLGSSLASFDTMLAKFGVVTVMNAKVYPVLEDYSSLKVDAILKRLEGEGETKKTPLCVLDTLKVANVTMEGPTKTITGGQNSNPLIKFGKTARLEMQDALGHADALEVFNGAVIEHWAEPNGHAKDDFSTSGSSHAIHATDQFSGPVAIVGESFFIDQKTGAQVPVKIIFYQFLPDSLMPLGQDAEGDASVFDLNGDLLATTVTVGGSKGEDIKIKDFYAVVPDEGPTARPTV